MDDVCLVKDSNLLRGEWRLGRVSACYADANGRVRYMEVSVKPHQSGSKDYAPTPTITIKRHVNSLIVIVPVEDS